MRLNAYAQAAIVRLDNKVVDKKHVIDPETAPAIKTVFEMYVKKHTPQEILEHLKSQHKSGKAQETLLNELGKVEAEKKIIEREIAKEKSRKIFMKRFANGDITDFFFREQLVETFIQKIEAHNDKITIWYTVQDGYFVEYPVCFSNGLAGAEGFEPSARGFGDHCSTN